MCDEWLRVDAADFERLFPCGLSLTIRLGHDGEAQLAIHRGSAMPRLAVITRRWRG